MNKKGTTTSDDSSYTPSDQTDNFIVSKINFTTDERGPVMESTKICDSMEARVRVSQQLRKNHLLASIKRQTFRNIGSRLKAEAEKTADKRNLKYSRS